MTSVKFYNCNYIPAAKLTYSVIAARFKGRWIFVRHNERSTWEISGGHIEEGESADEAAARELKEETGADVFTIVCVGVYSVEREGNTGFGKLYFAEVRSLIPVPDTSEIAEIMFADNLPEKLTYPDIQPLLFSKVRRYLQER